MQFITLVPVGEDNVQNVQVAQDLSKKFNRVFKQNFFPKPEILLVDDAVARVKSLRNPEKKMSKSDSDWRSCIYIDDSEGKLTDVRQLFSL